MFESNWIPVLMAVIAVLLVIIAVMAYCMYKRSNYAAYDLASMGTDSEAEALAH